jgi:phage terminase large subunit-like protein
MSGATESEKHDVVLSEKEMYAKIQANIKGINIKELLDGISTKAELAGQLEGRRESAALILFLASLRGGADRFFFTGEAFGNTERDGVDWILNQCRRGERKVAILGRTWSVTNGLLVGDLFEATAALPLGHPEFLYRTRPRQIEWPSGSIARLYCADKADWLRGTQHHIAWVHNVTDVAALDLLRLSLRLPLEDPLATFRALARESLVALRGAVSRVWAEARVNR